MCGARSRRFGLYSILGVYFHEFQILEIINETSNFYCMSSKSIDEEDIMAFPTYSKISYLISI
jgi:hypothetical protein